MSKSVKQPELKDGTRLFCAINGTPPRRFYEYDLSTMTTYRIRIRDGQRLRQVWWGLPHLEQPQRFREVFHPWLQLPEGL